MNKEEIKKAVHDNFNNIEKSFHKVLHHFNPTDIQQFRLDLKKLRAFFHMLDMEASGETHFRITSEMKTFYGYTGIIRNLYLLLQTIRTHSEFSDGKELAPFINKIEKEIIYWEKNTKDYAEQHKNFQVDEDKIIAGLPANLKNRSVKKFAGYLSYEVQTHLTRYEDENLNNIRKLLEDLLFNWEYLKPYSNKLPAGLRAQDEIYSLVFTLEDFRDKSAGSTILDNYYAGFENTDEKRRLEKVIRFYNTEKEQVRNKICLTLELLPVMPIVKRSFSL